MLAYRSDMNQDLAERVARTSVVVPELGPDHVHTIIATYLSEVARCGVCDGAGSISAGRAIHVHLADRGGRAEVGSTYVPQGTSMSCPRCGGDQSDASPHDPEHVGWFCMVSDYRGCAPGRPGDADTHSACGWRIMLPLPES